MGGHGGGFRDVLPVRPSIAIAQNHVTARRIENVKPDVFSAGFLEGQFVVFGGAASHQHLKTPRSQKTHAVPLP